MSGTEEGLVPIQGLNKADWNRTGTVGKHLRFSVQNIAVQSASGKCVAVRILGTYIYTLSYYML